MDLNGRRRYVAGHTSFRSPEAGWAISLSSVAVGADMKNLLPDRVELSVLAAMAVVCASAVQTGPKADLWLAVLSIPLFITAAVMGLRRNWRIADAREAVTKQVQASE